MRLESIAEDRHQLIHHYIPALSRGPAIGEVADIEEQNLDHRFIGGEHLAIGDVPAHLRMQTLDLSIPFGPEIRT